MNLLPESYQGYRTEPLVLDFDKLLHQGYAVSNAFKVQLNTNKGSRNLLFEKGETVELLIKMNRPGYYYLVGHSKNSESEMSYLLELNEAHGDRRFVSYLNADDANKWLSLGPVE